MTLLSNHGDLSTLYIRPLAYYTSEAAFGTNLAPNLKAIHDKPAFFWQRHLKDDHGIYTVTFQLDKPSAEPVTINWTSGGTAVQGTHWSTSATNSVDLRAGNTSFSLPITLIDMGKWFFEKTLDIRITDITGAVLGEGVNHCQIVIRPAADPPKISVTTTGGTVAASTNQTVTFTLSETALAGEEVKIHWKAIGDLASKITGSAQGSVVVPSGSLTSDITVQHDGTGTAGDTAQIVADFESDVVAYQEDLWDTDTQTWAADAKDVHVDENLWCHSTDILSSGWEWPQITPDRPFIASRPRNTLPGGTSLADETLHVVLAGPQVLGSLGQTTNLLYPEQVFPEGSGAPTSGIWTYIYGAANENERVLKTTPYNTQGVVWEAINQDVAGGPDGGVASSQYFNIDNTQVYRFSLWVRKQFVDAADGTVFFGPGGADAASLVKVLSSGSDDSNPYFKSTTSPPSSGTGIDDWYLWVGFVYAHDHVGTAQDPERGIYGRGGSHVSTGATYKWTPAATRTRIRFFQWTNTDPAFGETVDFFGPRVDVVDGTEPSITELLGQPEVDPNTGNPLKAFVPTGNYGESEMPYLRQSFFTVFGGGPNTGHVAKEWSRSVYRIAHWTAGESTDRDVEFHRVGVRVRWQNRNHGASFRTDVKGATPGFNRAGGEDQAGVFTDSTGVKHWFWQQHAGHPDDLYGIFEDDFGVGYYYIHRIDETHTTYTSGMGVEVIGVDTLNPIQYPIWHDSTAGDTPAEIVAGGKGVLWHSIEFMQFDSRPGAPTTHWPKEGLHWSPRGNAVLNTAAPGTHTITAS